eukprot:7265251-Pyramimonas_sp.AAC.2
MVAARRLDLHLSLIPLPVRMHDAQAAALEKPPVAGKGETSSIIFLDPLSSTSVLYANRSSPYSYCPTLTLALYSCSPLTLHSYCCYP